MAPFLAVELIRLHEVVLHMLEFVDAGDNNFRVRGEFLRPECLVIVHLAEDVFDTVDPGHFFIV